jgi:hypothetical protein
MPCPTCLHIKEDGTYCGSPALRAEKYCYYHLQQRGRRLRRARALRDNLPYQLDIESLDSPYAVRTAVTEIVQALASGQLDHAVAGKMLYGVQQAASMNKLIAQAQAAQPQSAPSAEVSRPEECPEFAAQFNIPPGSDIDAETDAVMKSAEHAAEIRHANVLPGPPPGVRPGSPQYQLYRDDTVQELRLRIDVLQRLLREYSEAKKPIIDQMRKEAMSATQPTAPVAKTA